MLEGVSGLVFFNEREEDGFGGSVALDLKEEVDEHFGRCPPFAWGCLVCSLYMFV